MTIALSPAALRLKHARSNFSRLKRAAAKNDLVQFERALEDMVAHPPSKTCSLHDWPSLVASHVLWQRDVNRLAMLELLVRNGPGLSHAHFLLVRCLMTDALECIPLLHDAGLRLNTVERDANGMIAKYIGCGQWPHLELIAPGFFANPDIQCDVAATIGDNAFQIGHYDQGEGFLSASQTSRILEMLDAKPNHASEDFYRNVIGRVALPRNAPLDHHPWAEGLAMVVEAGRLDWEDLAVRPGLSSCLEAARAEYDRRQLERNTPHAPPPSSRRTRL